MKASGCFSLVSALRLSIKLPFWTLSYSPRCPLLQRGRKLCRWRRKALINTTVSDRYADPHHYKMAAISPSHSSPFPSSLIFSSSLDLGCFSFSSPSVSTPPLPLIFTPWAPYEVFLPHKSGGRGGGGGGGGGGAVRLRYPDVVHTAISLEDPSYHFKIQYIHLPPPNPLSNLTFIGDEASYRHEVVSISHLCAMKSDGFFYCRVLRLEGF